MKSITSGIQKFSIISASFLACVFTTSARADIFHYNNVLVGERAIGLGGAYTAVADDASGVYYNPAGIAFAQSNDISGSGNAYYKKSLSYEDVLGSQDYVEEASGTFSPFLGILNKLDRFLPGLVGAFAMYTSDTELLNQNDRWPVVGVATSTTQATALYGFHRTVQLRTSTSHMALAAGYRMSGRLSVGFGLRSTMVDELSQDFQQSALWTVDIASEKIVKTETKYNNNRSSLKATGVEPSFGAQMALGQAFTVGISMRKGAFLSQEYTQAADTLTVTKEDATGVTAATVPSATTETPSVADTKVSNPLGSLPGEVRVGAAWFASPRLLVAGDLSYYDPATNGKISYFKRQAVLNYAIGTEYYVTPSIAVRAGGFTNRDSRPDLTKGKTGQTAHIDFVGGSLFLAYIQPNSQISVGAVMQQGSGKSQKLAGKTGLEDVKGSLTTFGFAATTSL